MTTDAQIPAALGDIALRHRERWILARCGDRAVLRLNGEADRLAAVRRAVAADEPGAIVWPAGMPVAGPDMDLREELVAAARRGWGVALVMPGIALESPRAPVAAHEEPETLAAALAAAFDGAEVVPQRLAEASVIASARGPLSGTFEDWELAAADVHAWLVLVGLPGPAGDSIALAAGTLHRTYLLWLEMANAELRRANVRLARERVGVHDTAAASLVNRVVAAEEAQRCADAERDAAFELLELEKQVAARNHSYFEAARRKLGEPHHRIAEGIVRRAGHVPGARHVGNRIARRLPPKT